VGSSSLRWVLFLDPLLWRFRGFRGNEGNFSGFVVLER
jgi:hypothetical protein